MFYQSSGEIRRRSEEQALLFIALGAVAFVTSVMQYYGQAQVRRNLLGNYHRNSDPGFMLRPPLSVRSPVQVAERLSLTLRSDMFEAMLRREMAFFDRKENSTGDSDQHYQPLYYS